MFDYMQAVQPYRSVSTSACKKTVSAASVGETVPIEFPVRASKSNGMMGGAVRIWQDQLRTIKHCTESRLGKRITADGALSPGLIPYCATTGEPHMK